MPVYVDNDVRAATWASESLASARGARHLVAVFVGSAIGAGLILDGEFYYGAGEGAGEIGHIQVVDHGPLCSCGKRGCLEAVASGRAIAGERWSASGGGSGSPSLSDKPHDGITAKDVAEAAKGGDPVAREIMERAARHIGWAVSVLVNTYNPEARGHWRRRVAGRRAIAGPDRKRSNGTPCPSPGIECGSCKAPWERTPAPSGLRL